MYFGKISLVLLIVSCFAINAQMTIKKRTLKTKIKKTSLPPLAAPGCGCTNPVIDILNCGCRGPIDPVFTPIRPIELPIPPPGPVIDVPGYRYAEPVELNPLACLFPSIEIPNYGILTAPMSVPSVEFFSPVLDVPCGCNGPCTCSGSFSPGPCGCNGPCTCSGPYSSAPCSCNGPCTCSGPFSPGPCGCNGPKCGYRAPAVKVPAYPYGSISSIEVPKCGCQTQLPGYGLMGPVIELPSYGPGLVQVSACGCQGPCGCAGIQVSSCGCQGPCTCPMPVSSCECMGPCGCSGMQMPSCGCSGMPVSSCGCVGPCACPSIQMPFYGCQLPSIEVPSWGCGCGVPGCGCGVPGCGCSVPGCGCSVPGCGCNPKYLRQVTLQPPFL